MQELSDKFPIVDERGNPNSYFIRFLQERGIGQGDLEKAIKALLLKKIVATDGGVTVAHGNFSDPLDTSIKTNLQFLLDALSASWGSILSGAQPVGKRSGRALPVKSYRRGDRPQTPLGSQRAAEAGVIGGLLPRWLHISLLHMERGLIKQMTQLRAC
jgi:hypothetical protein